MGEKLDEIKGRAKRAAGELTDDEGLKNEGSVDRASSGVKGKIDDVASKVKDAVNPDRDRKPDRESEAPRR